MKTSLLSFLTASAVIASASTALAGESRHNIGSPVNGYQLVHTTNNAGSKAPGNYHYIPAPVKAPCPITNNHTPIVGHAPIPKPVITHAKPVSLVPVHKPAQTPVKPQIKPVTPVKPVSTPVKPVSTPVKPVQPTKPEVKPETPPQTQEAIKRGNTTLAGDLGLKYNLGRDVSMTAKYGTDNRYGLAIGAQLTPSFGLDAEAYRKDQDNAIRLGLVYTLNPVEHKTAATTTVVQYVDRIVPSAPVIKYVDRVVTKTITKVIPYKPAIKSVRGRG